MTGFSPRAIKSFEVARAVFELLAASKIDTAIIGSVALAVHGYVSTRSWRSAGGIASRAGSARCSPIRAELRCEG